MPLRERKNPDEWEDRGRFYYRTVAQDGRPRTYQVSKTLEQELLQRGIGEGHSFRGYEVHEYLQDELFFTLNTGSNSKVRLRDLPVGVPRYADNAPHFFHVRLRLVSEFDPATGTVEAEVVEAPDSVLVVPEDVEQADDLSVLFDDEGEFSSIPKRLTVWFESGEQLPDGDQFVRIALSRHPDSDAIFACCRPYPRRNEQLTARDGTEYKVRELLHPNFKLVTPSGMIETVRWSSLVGEGEELAASLADSLGRKLAWKVQRKSPLRGRKVVGKSEWRYDYELKDRLSVRTRLRTDGTPVERLALTSLSLRSLPATSSFFEQASNGEAGSCAFGLLTTEAARLFVEHVLVQSEQERWDELIGKTSLESRERSESLIDGLMDGKFPGYSRSSIEISMRLGLTRDGDNGAALVAESLREFIESSLLRSDDFTIWIGVPPDEETILSELLTLVAKELGALEVPVEFFELADIREELERQIDPFGAFELTPMDGSLSSK